MKSCPANVIGTLLFAESYASSTFTPQDVLGYREIKTVLDYKYETILLSILESFDRSNRKTPYIITIMVDC